MPDKKSFAKTYITKGTVFSASVFTPVSLDNIKTLIMSPALGMINGYSVSIINLSTIKQAGLLGKLLEPYDQDKPGISNLDMLLSEVAGGATMQIDGENIDRDGLRILAKAEVAEAKAKNRKTRLGKYDLDDLNTILDSTPTITVTDNTTNVDKNPGNSSEVGIEYIIDDDVGGEYSEKDEKHRGGNFKLSSISSDAKITLPAPQEIESEDTKTKAEMLKLDLEFNGIINDQTNNNPNNSISNQEKTRGKNTPKVTIPELQLDYDTVYVDKSSFSNPNTAQVMSHSRSPNTGIPNSRSSDSNSPIPDSPRSNSTPPPPPASPRLDTPRLNNNSSLYPNKNVRTLSTEEGLKMGKEFNVPVLNLDDLEIEDVYKSESRSSLFFDPDTARNNSTSTPSSSTPNSDNSGNVTPPIPSPDSGDKILNTPKLRDAGKRIINMRKQSIEETNNLVNDSRGSVFSIDDLLNPHDVNFTGSYTDYNKKNNNKERSNSTSSNNSQRSSPLYSARSNSTTPKNTLRTEKEDINIDAQYPNANGLIPVNIAEDALTRASEYKAPDKNSKVPGNGLA